MPARPKSGETRQNNGRQHQPVGAGFIGPAHFLDGKDDSGKRRVEGGGNTGGGASENEATRMGEIAKAGRLQHQRCTDLDGRSFTADGGTAQKADHRQQDFSGRQPQR